VDVPKIFNGFEMKKEFQEKYKKTEAIRKRVLDSLSFKLQIMAKQLKANPKNEMLVSEFDFRREDFFKRRDQIDQDNAALSAQYDKQILEQMSQYIMDYGKKNNCDLILGADGNGTLMYANEKMNISEEIIGYINDKYKGIE
jgi:outer membrane protein